jgi:hypothetical protein
MTPEYGPRITWFDLVVLAVTNSRAMRWMVGSLSPHHENLSASSAHAGRTQVRPDHHQVFSWWVCIPHQSVARVICSAAIQVHHDPISMALPQSRSYIPTPAIILWDVRKPIPKHPMIPADFQKSRPRSIYLQCSNDCRWNCCQQTEQLLMVRQASLVILDRHARG